MVLALQVVSDAQLSDWVAVLVHLVEIAGALVIFAGALIAIVRFTLAGFGLGRTKDFVRVRFGLGRYLALGLEFQLASDVLRTAVAPSFREIGQLGAVAAIRTALNYFLAKEINQERAEVEGT